MRAGVRKHQAFSVIQLTMTSNGRPINPQNGSRMLDKPLATLHMHTWASIDRGKTHRKTYRLAYEGANLWYVVAPSLSSRTVTGTESPSLVMIHGAARVPVSLRVGNRAIPITPLGGVHFDVHVSSDAWESFADRDLVHLRTAKSLHAGARSGTVYKGWLKQGHDHLVPP